MEKDATSQERDVRFFRREPTVSENWNAAYRNAEGNFEQAEILNKPPNKPPKKIGEPEGSPH